MTYNYDGDGNRVKKSSGTVYWYGAGTEILDESNASGTITNEYVFFGGKRVAMRNVTSGTIYYYEEDMLGSSRTMVQAGQTSVCYDADFYPFGGERDITNTCTQHYKFEGKERDTETGNDDFGARYYTSRLGRWLSADWSSVPAPVPYANLTNPQTLNLYAMVSDNPETFADLDGHASGSMGQCDQLVDVCATLQGQALEGDGPVQPNTGTGTGTSTTQQAQKPCGFWCKLGRALGITETEQEKKDAAAHRDWINKHVLQNGKRIDANHMSDTQVNNFFDMIMFGIAMGRIPVEPLTVDATGKIHGELPDSVPDDLTRGQLEEMRDALSQSIKTRLQESADYGGPDASHMARIRQEQQLLRQVEDKLGH